MYSPLKSPLKPPLGALLWVLASAALGCTSSAVDEARPAPTALPTTALPSEMADAWGDLDPEREAPEAEVPGAEAPEVVEIVEPARSPERAAAFLARAPRSVVALQQWRLETAGASGAALIDLSPAVGEWFLLTPPGGDSAQPYHLENHAPTSLTISLAPDAPDGLLLRVGDRVERCPLWGGSTALAHARASGLPFAPLCGGLLSLRNPTQGQRTSKEWATDFLRDNVWKGEQLTTLVKGSFYRDGDLISAELIAGPSAQSVPPDPPGAPLAAALETGAAGWLPTVDLGLPLVGAEGAVAVGRWYAVEGAPGVFASAAQPRLAEASARALWGDRIHPLDAVEGAATVYLVAFDLSQLTLSYDMGTDHPRLGWSESAVGGVRTPGMPGPDGFDTLSPLVRNGMVNPARLPSLVSTFTGGFKRSHGAFSQGALAQVNAGSHYGWVEHGVVESRPRPGLMTVIVWLDGEVELRVWREADDASLWRVRHLRQNGVPLLEPGPDGAAVPGALLLRWGEGNWSGSVDGRLRSARGSLCLQESPRGRFLIYGYFSSATPSAMAATLGAYGCGAAMLTDMNALEHTYLSIHRYRRGDYTVRHLITGMSVIDGVADGVYLPRFVGQPDNRDFFTVWRRQ